MKEVTKLFENSKNKDPMEVIRIIQDEKKVDSSFIILIKNMFGFGEKKDDGKKKKIKARSKDAPKITELESKSDSQTQSRDIVKWFFKKAKV